MSSYGEIPDELIEFVEVKVNGYFVKKGSVDGGITFGKFNSLKEACAAACILYKNNWKLNDVGLDPLVNYGGEFWVFKIERNKLVLDNKFDDYETAVEYMEISSRCNDYHNDIFRDSIKKNGYKDRWESSQSDYVSPIEDECIFREEDKFIVKKSKRSWIIYGEFDSFAEASAAKKLLIDLKWKISNKHEIVFFNEYYWVFDVIDGILTFNGKSQSYEDALDLITPSTTQEYENPIIKSIDENIDKIAKKRKAIPKKYHNSKLRKKTVNYKNNDSRDYEEDYLNVKTSVDITRIWNPPINDIKQKNEHIRIFVERCGDNVQDLSSILDFTFAFSRKVKCIVDGDEIEWNRRNNVHISNFPEFKFIIRILEINNWDLSKINNSSSIYFDEGNFYKVHVLDNTIIFGKFASYNIAENTLLIYNGRPLISVGHDDVGIDERGNRYELIKFQSGKIYKTLPLKSLEETKAVRDILIHANWDFGIFENYDLFYLNGFYWELKYNNGIITLIGKYEFIKTL